jgi:hypothetical protein
MNYPSLVVPVFRGGEFFQEAVDSIKPCLPWFSRVIISLNGADTTQDRATAMQLAPLCQLHILETKRDLTSVQHGVFIANQLVSRLGLEKKSQVFTLCHDDLLSLEGFQALNQEDWKQPDPHMISLGDYIVFNDGEPSSHGTYKTSFENSQVEGRQRPQSFFLEMQNQGIDPFTNVSGMQMTIAVIRSTLRYFKCTGARIGIRAEYAYISNREVRTIVNHNPPLVIIRAHAQSEGAKITYGDFIPGELRYLCWLWLNCKSLHEFQELQKGRYGLKSLLWLSSKTLQHRYYDLLGFLRQLAARLGLRK